MAVTANDIVIYASATMPTGDVVFPGGAIDTGTKMTFTDMQIGAGLADGLVVSSNGISDELQVEVTGRNTGGSIVSDKFTIFSTLAKNTGISVTQFERVLRMVVSSGSHTGTIAIERDDFPTHTSLGTMEIGINNIYRPFYDVSSAASNGKEYWEKVFVKNNSITNNLLSAAIVESGEIGFTNKITFDLAASGNDNGTSSSNRLGSPPATQLLSGDTGTGYTNDSKAVISGDLTTGENQGIWVKLSLATADPADSGRWVLQVNGNTTA